MGHRAEQSLTRPPTGVFDARGANMMSGWSPLDREHGQDVIELGFEVVGEEPRTGGRLQTTVLEKSGERAGSSLGVGVDMDSHHGDGAPGRVGSIPREEEGLRLEVAAPNQPNRPVGSGTGLGMRQTGLAHQAEGTGTTGGRQRGEAPKHSVYLGVGMVACPGLTGGQADANVVPESLLRRSEDRRSAPQMLQGLLEGESLGVHQAQRGVHPAIGLVDQRVSPLGRWNRQLRAGHGGRLDGLVHAPREVVEGPGFGHPLGRIDGECGVDAPKQVFSSV
jgi:hypothetical protein